MIKNANWLEKLAFFTLILLSCSFAFEFTTPLLSVGNIAFTNVEVLALLTVILWTGSHLLARTWPRVPRALVIPVLAWLVVMIAATVFAPDNRDHAVKFVSRMVQGVLLGWVVYDLAITSKRRRVISYALVACGLVVGIVGIAEALNVPIIVNLLTAFHDNQTRVGDVIRVSSTLSYTTIAAMVLEMLVPLTLAALLTTSASQHGRRVVFIVALGAMIVTLVLTLTRTALVGVLIALGIMAVFGLRRTRVLLWGSLISAGAVIAVAGAILIFNPVVGLRLLSENVSAWYQASYTSPAEITARPNELINVNVTLTNMGLRTWELSDTDPFQLSYSIARENDPSFKPLDGLRSAILIETPPGGHTDVTAQFLPPTPGNYLILWDMVEEHVLWFSWQGSPLGKMRLIIAGTPLAVQPIKLGLAAHVTELPPVDRPQLWTAALRMFRTRPILGYGPDNFRLDYGPFIGLDRWNMTTHANNLYLEFLADTGIIGLLAFLWLSWRLLRNAARKINQPVISIDSLNQIWQIALFASLTTWFIHGILDYFFEFTPTYVLFWIIAGLALSTAHDLAQRKPI